MAVSLLLHVLPGALLLRLARLPRWLALAAAPAVSAGVVALAVAWTTTTGVRWGLLPVLATLAVLAAATAATRWVLRRRRPPAATAPGAHAVSTAGPVTSCRRLVDLAALAVAVGGSWWVQVPGIGRPDALQQSHDPGFHVNALARVLAQQDAGWTTVVQTSSPQATSGFYPSGLHAHAALVAQLTGGHPVVVLNVVVLVLAAFVWPVGVLAVVRSLTPDPAARLLAALLVPVTLVYPTLLLHFGALWSNHAALALTPGLLALVVALCRPAVAGCRGAVRVGAGLLALLAALGVGLTHPSALLSLLLVAIPLLVASTWREVADVVRDDPARRRRALVGLAAALAACALVVGAVLASPTVARLLRSRTRTVTDAAQATREILTLGTHLSPGWLVLAALVAVGAVVAVRGRDGWLVTGLVVIGACYVVAASCDSGPLTLLTALWDREPYRVAAPVAIPALALAATGGAAVLRAARDRGPVPGTAAAVALAVLVLTGWPSAVASAQQLVGRNYGDQEPGRTVVSVAESRVYRDVLGPRADGRAVAGDPFGGAQWAGPISGHPSVYAHFAGVYGPDEELVRGHLRELTPQVCAAVRRLDLGYVVEDTQQVWGAETRPGRYPGLHHLDGVPGLTRIGGEGTVGVYEITGC